MNTQNVNEFAVGDGVTDDSVAFQTAIDLLVPSGGVLYVPPNRTYIVGDVEINSLYPIWIKSDMCNHLLAGGAATTWAGKSNIRPPAAGCSHIFKWERHASITTGGFGAGGGIEGLSFGDIDTAGGNDHARAITSGAVWIDDAAAFTIRDSEFQHLLGTAVRVDESTYCKLSHLKFYFCGNATGPKPVIDAGGAASQAYLWTERCFIENCYATHILLQAGGALNHNAGYHENSGGVAAVTFIDGTDGVAHIYDSTFNNTQGSSIILGGNTGLTNGSSIQNCKFQNFPGTNSTIKILANSVYTRLHNLQIAAAGQTAPIIEIDANDCTLSNIYTQSGGQIKIDGANCMLSNIYCRNPSTPSGQYQIDCTAAYALINGGFINGHGLSVCHGIRMAAGQILDFEVFQLDGGDGVTTTGFCTVCNVRSHTHAGGTDFVLAAGNVVGGNYSSTVGAISHYPAVYQVIPIPIAAWRLSSMGVLTGATTPNLALDANGFQYINWDAGNDDFLAVQVSLPEGFDGTRDVTVELTVRTDNTGGGGIDAGGHVIHSSWDGGALVLDSALDSVPATTAHTITATIAAADIPDTARYVTIYLDPQTHANDPIHVLDAKIRVPVRLAM